MHTMSKSNLRIQPWTHEKWCSVDIFVSSNIVIGILFLKKDSSKKFDLQRSSTPSHKHVSWSDSLKPWGSKVVESQHHIWCQYTIRHIWYDTRAHQNGKEIYVKHISFTHMDLTPKPPVKRNSNFQGHFSASYLPLVKLVFDTSKILSLLFLLTL